MYLNIITGGKELFIRVIGKIVSFIKININMHLHVIKKVLHDIYNRLKSLF